MISSTILEKVRHLLPGLQTYSVQKAAKRPLNDFVLEGLRDAGCRVLFASEPDCAPFVATFETPNQERIGIVAYLFLAKRTVTKNRPADERSFQIKYSDKDEYRRSNLHQLWQDPQLLYTTLFAGVDPQERFFVAADPVLHSPTKFFIRLEFKDRHASDVQRNSWAHWRRDRRTTLDKPENWELLVGGQRHRVIDLIRFERVAKGVRQADRESLAKLV